MFKPRRLITGVVGVRNLYKIAQNAPKKNTRSFHYEEPTEAFDNLPFRVTSRYTLTVAFTIVFGAALWAPFFILWYSMAKRTM